MQPSVLSHRRSPVVYAGALLLAAALLTLAPRLGSVPVALGAGIASGGAVATAVCGIAWDDGVPNPLAGGDIAFNVADLAIAAGVVLLVAGALVHAVVHRRDLLRPV